MYEGKIRDGNILVALHGENNDQLKQAEDLFKANKATDIHRVGEAAVKKSLQVPLTKKGTSIDVPFLILREWC
ncbi:MAG: hypothetical protein K2X93_14735 [Candidatus Obscuribacterales bacterium]|nr:hypothetical protein [Candidatus Obscuribacterales bacterium]